MSSPLTGETGCSRLSPFIALGNISMRSIHQQTQARVDELKQQRSSGMSIEPNWLKSLSSFKSRLSWHCHFMQKLEDEPEIEFRNFNRAYDGLRENEFNDEYFAAWCAGRTGYPMVDACMRALHQTGWINFRMRAMLVSFASYHLWLHWRQPAIYLARLFLDYEPGIHYSQIQMQAGVTGINTVRIYSPIKQVIDQDPEGIFIRRYLPELANVPDKHLAEPHKMTAMEQTLFECQIGVDYPAPIVDHKTQYKIARDRMHNLKKLPQTRQASEQVFQKHGSRKTPMRRR
jgi:deoxyribodipyrimidine photo-lyase